MLLTRILSFLTRYTCRSAVSPTGSYLDPQTLVRGPHLSLLRDPHPSKATWFVVRRPPTTAASIDDEVVRVCLLAQMRCLFHSLVSSAGDVPRYQFQAPTHGQRFGRQASHYQNCLLLLEHALKRRSANEGQYAPFTTSPTSNGSVTTVFTFCIS